jgi:endonuclease YncB( thermonuclease family)
MKTLEPGLVTQVDYVRAVDGDTIEFEIRRTFKVRLRDIDVYEKNTEKGKEATEYVDTILKNAREILVFIPTNDPHKLMDINSFERVIGEVYVDNKNIANILRMARLEKRI